MMLYLELLEIKSHTYVTKMQSKREIMSEIV